MIYGFLPTSEIQLRNDRLTAEITARAKEALIGRAASSATRPGQLPCPDTNNDGVAEAADTNGCPSGNIGRLPWITLGIGDLRDAAGERLWYAVSTRFTRNPPCTLTTPASSHSCYLNSDTRGNLTVSQDLAAQVITSEAVAVIFAPGATVPGQIRSAANVNNPVHYLDTADGVNNAIAGGPFISAIASSTFNDKLFVLTTSQLMPVVEMRVAREVLKLLEAYRTATGVLGYNGGTGVYPWTDCADGDSDIPYENRNRIPWHISSASPTGVTYPVDWGSGGTPSLPAWFRDNYWQWVIFYAVGRGSLDSGESCSTCEVGQTFLQVNGVWDKRVLIIMTGPAGTGPGGAARPAVLPGSSGTCDSTHWQMYLDDSENYSGGNDRYITPSSTEYARDRLYACPGTPGIC